MFGAMFVMGMVCVNHSQWLAKKVQK